MPELSIASWNTHRGLDVSYVAYDVVRGVANIDADIVALQECWRPAPGEGSADEAAHALDYHLYEGPFMGGSSWDKMRRVYSPDEEKATFGIVVLSRYKAIRQGLVPLGRTPYGLHRAVLVLDIDVDGTPLRFCATHLEYTPHGSVSELFKLRAMRDLLGPDSTASALAGDFNMWGPVVESITGLRRGPIGKTWPAQRPHSQLDHILTAGPIETLWSEVLAPQGSDHRPIKAQMWIGD